MNLISLNLWGGIVFEPLIKFVKEKSSDVDIFCFQEVLFGSEAKTTPIHKARANIFSEIKNIIYDFSAHTHFSNSKHFISEAIDFPAGQAIFIKNTIGVKSEGGFYTYPDGYSDGETGKTSGNCQWIEIVDKNSLLTIANFHGIWQKDLSTKDTPERIYQSEVVKKFFDQRSGRKILCGDFNLSPDIESTVIIEAGMRNLIKEHNIKNTRSQYYKRENMVADYILVSSDIEIHEFKVLQDVVSDHLPLFVQFT